MTAKDSPDTLLFAVDKRWTARVGLLPMHYLDSFPTRSTIIGQLNDVSKIVFDPEGEMFAVLRGELYRGHAPLDGKQDWFSTARRVGKADWDKFKFLLFDPHGILYAITKDGEFYKGPAPSNENVSWLYGEATKIGNSEWNKFHAIFFDPDGILYAVSDDKLVRRSPPTGPEDEWLHSSLTIEKKGWRNLTHFIACSPEGDLWCVDSKSGNLFKGSIASEGLTSYIDRAMKMGKDYLQYPLLSFTADKTIQSILSFEFLPELGKLGSFETEVLQTQTYNNKSSVPLNHTFSFIKKTSQSSTFTHEHGFSVAAGTEIEFKTGIPFIVENSVKVTVDLSTTNTWSYGTTNVTESSFASNADITVPGGKAIRVEAAVIKGELKIPYKAKIRTLFGCEAEVKGTWQGCTHYGLTVTQEDCNPCQIVALPLTSDSSTASRVLSTEMKHNK